MSKTKSSKSPAQKMSLVATSHGGATEGVGTLSLFKKAGEGVSRGMKVKSRSPMLKPDQFPVGRLLSGIIKGLIPCVAHKGTNAKRDVTKYGCLIEIVPDLNSVGVAIPATATLISALEIIETEKDGAPSTWASRYINHRVEIEKLAEKIPSKKGQSAWNFLVAVSEEPATV